MIPTTETAKPAPRRSDRSVLASSTCGVGRTLGRRIGHGHGPLGLVGRAQRRRAPDARERERDHAQGGERCDRHAQADHALSPSLPTATARANKKREVDSRKPVPP